ncbi:hypothetical protein PSFL107428_13990 [Pseudoalteromonas maricaloris]
MQLVLLLGRGEGPWYNENLSLENQAINYDQKQ